MKIERNYYESPVNVDQFHGTRRNIEGGVLQPSNVHGISNYDYDRDFANDAAWRKSHVFMVNNEQAAWNWANMGSHPAGTVRGRERVHVVEPVGKTHPDGAGDLFENSKATAAPRARIKDTIWIPPPNENDGPIQGTLPPENWARHMSPDADWRDKATANAIPVIERVARDTAHKRDVATGGPYGHIERVESNVRTAKNLASHPKLFNDDQFQVPTETPRELRFK